MDQVAERQCVVAMFAQLSVGTVGFERIAKVGRVCDNKVVGSSMLGSPSLDGALLEMKMLPWVKREEFQIVSGFKNRGLVNVDACEVLFFFESRESPCQTVGDDAAAAADVQHIVCGQQRDRSR